MTNQKRFAVQGPYPLWSLIEKPAQAMEPDLAPWVAGVVISFAALVALAPVAIGASAGAVAAGVLAAAAIAIGGTYAICKSAFGGTVDSQAARIQCIENGIQLTLDKKVLHQ